MPTLRELLGGAVTQAGVTVTADSNITPSVVVYNASDSGPSLLDLIGVKTHISVRTADGQVIAEYGEPVETNLLLAGVIGAAIIVLVSLAGGGVVKALKLI